MTDAAVLRSYLVVALCAFGLAMVLACAPPTVRLRGDGFVGHGCAIEGGLIATVAHVASGELSWKAGRLESVVRHRTRDGIVYLRPDPPFMAAWLPPAAVGRKAVPGDSGSPAFDEQGRVWGLVSGHNRHGELVIVPLPEAP